MRRREFLTLLGGAALARPVGAHAQQLKLIGVLTTYPEGDVEGRDRFGVFRDELQKLGWTNGRNVRLSISESKLGTTLGILIFLTLFIGFTVDLFGNMSIMIPLLAGARARLGELGRSPGASNPSISSSPKRPLSQAGFDSGLRARRSGARLALRSQRNFADGASR